MSDADAVARSAARDFPTPRKRSTTPRGIATSPRAPTTTPPAGPKEYQTPRERRRSRGDPGVRANNAARGRARLGLRRRVGNRRVAVAERVENPEGPSRRCDAAQHLREQRRRSTRGRCRHIRRRRFGNRRRHRLRARPFERAPLRAPRRGDGGGGGSTSRASTSSTARRHHLGPPRAPYILGVDALGVRRQTVPDRRSIGARPGPPPTAASEYKPATRSSRRRARRDARPPGFDSGRYRTIVPADTPPRPFRGGDAVRSPEDSDVGAKSASKSNAAARRRRRRIFPGRTYPPHPSPTRRRSLASPPRTREASTARARRRRPSPSRTR